MYVDVCDRFRMCALRKVANVNEANGYYLDIKPIQETRWLRDECIA
jgi:hypothetical protein